MKKRILDGAKILGISIAGLVLLEAGLRIVFPEKLVGSRFQFYRTPLQYHPEYIYSLRPNLEWRYERDEINGGDIIPLQTNSRSLRGNELRSDSDVRILVFGDSNIEGRFSRLKDTFTSKLESYLNHKQDRDIEVVNAGTRGFGPDQNLIRLSLEVDSLDADMVVFHIFADNDFGDLIRNGLFDVEEGRLTRRYLPQRSNSLQRHISEFTSSLLITHAMKKFLKALSQLNAPTTDQTAESYVAELIALTEAEYAAFKNDGDSPLNRGSLSTDHYDIDIAIHPASESSEKKIEIMEKIILEVRNLLRLKEIDLLVLIQPSVVDLTNNYEVGHQYLERYSSYSRERLTSIVADICARLGIAHLNLFPVFLENEPETLFFQAVDDHWNESGQDLAAATAAELIHRSFLHAAPRVSGDGEPVAQ